MVGHERMVNHLATLLGQRFRSTKGGVRQHQVLVNALESVVFALQFAQL